MNFKSFLLNKSCKQWHKYKDNRVFKNKICLEEIRLGRGMLHFSYFQINFLSNFLALLIIGERGIMFVQRSNLNEKKTRRIRWLF